MRFKSKRWIAMSLLIGLTLIFITGCTVTVREGPPPPPPPPRIVPVPPPPPAPGYQWVPGHWEWDGKAWIWIQGHWR